jgi:hypothetical protein
MPLVWSKQSMTYTMIIIVANNRGYVFDFIYLRRAAVA